MKVLLAIVVLFVAGCASAPVVQIDQKCDNVAMFARSVAIVRDIGVKESDFNQFVLKPSVQTFPVEYVKHQVFMETKTPVDTYKFFYDKCLLVGYDNLYRLMKQEQDLAALTDVQLPIENIIK